MQFDGTLPEDQYRLLTEHSPVMIWRSDRDGACDYFNATWLAFTGRPMEAELGKGWTTGVHTVDLERCLERYLDHFGRREPFEMEYRLRRHDGEYRWIFDRGVPYYDDGRFAGFIGSCIDIHERKTADETKATFLGMVAHEQRSPLQACSAYLESIRRASMAGRPVEPAIVDKIAEQLSQLSRLVVELGDAARLERGVTFRFRPQRLDLSVVLNQTVAVHVDRTRSAGSGSPQHHVRLNVPDVPAPLHADADALNQLFHNLVDNAIKYSPQGGDIDIVVEGDEEGYRVRIADSGIGIPEEDLAGVTRPFFRAGNAGSGQFPGIGLGLAHCRNVVERHGGRLAIESTEGLGTTVTVYLPRRRDSTGEEDGRSERI